MKEARKHTALQRALSILLTLAMVTVLIPAVTFSFEEENTAKAYSTFTKNWSTEYYYPSGGLGQQSPVYRSGL